MFPSQTLYLSRFQGERRIRAQQNTGLKESALMTQCLQTSRRLAPLTAALTGGGWLVPGRRLKKESGFKELMSPIPGHKMIPVQPSRGVHAPHSWSISFTLHEVTDSEQPLLVVVTVVPRTNPTACKIKVLCRMWTAQEETVSVHVSMYTSVYAHVFT